jgi:DNA-binding GntR family transcriptional regulator
MSSEIEPGAERRGRASGRARRGGVLTGRLYRRLLADILHGSLEPGSQLQLLRLSGRYGTSTTTVRHALAQLESDGLVVSRPGRGFHIAPATLSDLLELVETACWLEEIGIRESMAGGDQLWEEDVLAAYRGLSHCPGPAGRQTDKELSAWEEHLLDFHEALVSACRSSILIHQCRSLTQRLLRYRNLASAATHRSDDQCEWLQQMCNAVLARDADGAVQLLDAHYRTIALGVLASGVLN